MPSPIFAAAIIGVEKLLRIDLDLTQRPVSFVRRVLDRLPEGVIAFGKTVGFVINYSPDQAVRFDRNGQPIEILDKAVRPATAVLCLGRRPITAEALGLVFGKQAKMESCELRRLISQKTRNEAFVKNKAELVVLAANARIGEEIKLIPKANKKLTNGRGATGIPHTSRSRLRAFLVHKSGAIRMLQV